MSNDTITIAITLHAPELVGAIRQLAEAIGGKPAPQPEAKKQPVETPAAVVAPASVPTVTRNVTYEEVHATLVKLKQQKSATPVREILTAMKCKTVQDIPAERFGEVLQMASERLAA